MLATAAVSAPELDYWKAWLALPCLYPARLRFGSAAGSRL